MNTPIEASKSEAPPAIYEQMYAADDRTYENPAVSPYHPLYIAAVKAILAGGGRRVLEVGCGSGTLAQMVIEEGLDYRGFDYARTAIAKALQRNPNAKFAWGDATADGPYAEPYDTILCCEVLEHIRQDLDVIKQWRPGCNVVCSVPNYDYESHVRFFRNEKEVLDRYSDVIAFDSIERLKKSQRAGLTIAEYFRRIRWAREHGVRRVLGTLGINTFEWSGGWFLFTGRRKR